MSYSPFADESLDLMTQTVTLAPFTGRNSYGDMTWGAAKTYHCRISDASAAVYTASGEEIHPHATILIHPKATDGTVLTTLGVEPDNAKITLPTGETPRILSVGANFDEAGIVYWKVMT